MQGDRMGKTVFFDRVDRQGDPAIQTGGQVDHGASKYSKNAAMDIATGGTSIYSGFAFMRLIVWRRLSFSSGVTGIIGEGCWAVNPFCGRLQATKNHK